MSDVSATLSMALQKVRRTNSTDASYPSRIPRLAVLAGADNAPSGIGDAAAQTTLAVFDLVDPKARESGGIKFPLAKAEAPNLVKLVPFGVGSDDNTFLMRVIGWHLVFDRGAEQSLYGAAVGDAMWDPVPLGEFTCTLCTQIGVAQGVIGATNRFCDTITVVGTSGTNGIDFGIYSPANNTQAHVVVDMKGSQKLEVIFDRNSSATSCNALASMY